MAFKSSRALFLNGVLFQFVTVYYVLLSFEQNISAVFVIHIMLVNFKSQRKYIPKKSFLMYFFMQKLGQNVLSSG